jgi:hypothetical protein
VQGEDTFKGDGTLEDMLRSFAFWLGQLFRLSRILCKQCKSLHIVNAEEEVTGKVDLTLAQYCLTCHQELHEDPDHRLRSGSDVDCHACHVPLKDNLGRPSIHDHKYVIAGLVKSPSSSSRR